MSPGREREEPRRSKRSMEGRRIISLDSGDRARALAHVALFSSLPEESLDDVAAHATLLAFPAGRVIVPQGEEGLGFYVVLSGTVRVERDGAPIAHLGPDDFFGEGALLEGAPRSATVLADTDVACLGILRSHFKALLVRHPRLALRILDEEARRRPAPPIDVESSTDQAPGKPDRR